MEVLWVILCFLVAIPIGIIGVLVLDELTYQVGRRIGAPLLFRLGAMLLVIAVLAFLAVSEVIEISS